MGRRRAVGSALVGPVALLAAALHGCGGTVVPAEPASVVPRGSAATPPVARYVLGGIDWSVESSGSLERVIASRGRYERSGDRVVAIAPPEPPVERGLAMPRWAPAGRFPYVFWDQRSLYGAETFTGPLVPIAQLRAPVRDVSPWLDGLAVVAGGGLHVVKSASHTLDRPPRPGLAFGLAADETRAVVQSRLGETWWTRDGGATFTEVPAELGDVAEVWSAGDDIGLRFEGGAERFLTRAGDLSGERSTPEPPDDGEDVEGDAWPEDEIGIWSAVASAGVSLGPSTGLVSGFDHFGLVDLETGRARVAAPLPLDLRECQPLVAGARPLLVCRDERTGYVFDVGSEVRLERAFPRHVDQRMDVFAGTEAGGLAFVGPCAGYAGPRPEEGEPDAVSGATPLNPYPQRSGTVCVREEEGSWREHTLEPSDASDVFGWVPKRDGGAVALVGRRGSALVGEPRVVRRGALWIVRVAREEPPLGLPRYPYSGGELLRRDLWVDADGSVSGWLGAQGSPSGTAAYSISPEGLPRQWPMPAGVTTLAARGRHGLAIDEEQALFETTDGGRTWRAVERPPGDPMATPAQCTELGCTIGAFVRVGWDRDRAPAEPPEPPREDPRQYYGRQDPPPSPLVRLECSFAGPPRSARQAGDYGFGINATPVSQPRGAGRIGIIGSLDLPQWSGQPPLTGEVTGAWMRPFDTSGAIARRTVDLAGVEIQYPPYRVDLGVVLRADGDVSPIVIGSDYNCPTGLLEKLGLIRPLGGCHGDPTVGVDLGDGVVFFSAKSNELVVGGLGARFAGGRRGAPGAPPIELAKRAWIGSLDRRLAAGFSEGERPVVVAMDAEGDATLASFDPASRTFGRETSLAPFRALELGQSPACRGPSAGEARVAMRLTEEIGLAPASLPGVVTLGTDGFAVLRWSPSRLCLDALDLEISDERWQQYLQRYVPHNASRRLVARFTGTREPRAALVVIEPGAEIVQPIGCTEAAP